ncbi:MAG: F0F1 ATP synthase subunit A [Nitrospirae bacterium]|nr:F0F1 ATP synthase subunit A [Nitrospirota bacterium]
MHSLQLGSWHVPAHIVYTWIVMALLIGMSLMVRSNLKQIPGGLQNLVEAFIGGIRDFTVNTMGPHGLDYFPLIGTAAFFILISNLIGVIPGFESPTSNLNTTAACALVVFASTHVVGLSKHGLGYIKHFMGPVPWLIWLMFPIEVIGHLARPVSLSLRLFGNIKGEDLVIAVLFLLVPYLLPSVMLGVAIFTSFVQTFVFCLLTMLYLAGAMEHAH